MRRQPHAGVTRLAHPSQTGSSKIVPQTRACACGALVPTDHAHIHYCVSAGEQLAGLPGDWSVSLDGVWLGDRSTEAGAWELLMERLIDMSEHGAVPGDVWQYLPCPVLPLASWASWNAIKELAARQGDTL